MLSIKKLNEVMRASGMYAQTKALYSYLWTRGDYKSGLSYPPKSQILGELPITEKLYNQGIAVLLNKGYIRETTKECKDKEGKKYTINAFDLSDYDNTKKEVGNNGGVNI